MSLIYAAIHIDTRKMYIGKTQFSVEKRKLSHCVSANKGSLSVFHRAIRKYGIEAFEWSVLKEVEDPDDLDVWERYFISKLKTKLPNGYNMTDGGEGGVPTEDVRKRLSFIRKGITWIEQFGEEDTAIRILKLNARWQTPHIQQKRNAAIRIALNTPETKERLRQRNIGRKATPDTLLKKSKAQTQVWENRQGVDRLVISGENNIQAKLTINKVVLMRLMVSISQYSYADLSVLFNVTPECASCAVRRLTWKHVP